MFLELKTKDLDDKQIQFRDCACMQILISGMDLVRCKYIEGS
jgi:hypothetical protein